MNISDPLENRVISKIVNDIETEYRKAGNLNQFQVSIIQDGNCLNVDNFPFTDEQIFFFSERLSEIFRNRAEILEELFAKIENCIKKSEHWIDVHQQILELHRKSRNLQQLKKALYNNQKLLDRLEQIQKEATKDLYQIFYKKFRENVDTYRNALDLDSILGALSSENTNRELLLTTLIDFLPKNQALDYFYEKILYLINSSTGSRPETDRLNQKNALHYASQIGNVSVLTVMEQLGQNITRAVNQKDKNGHSPLYIALFESQEFEFAKELIKRGADINEASPPKFLSLIHLAIINHNQEALELLLSNENINVTIQDLNGNTPFHAAAAVNNVPAMKALLNNRDMPQTTNYFGDTPLDLALEEGHDEMIQILTDKDPKEFPNYLKTRIHINQSNVLKKLIHYLEMNDRDTSVLNFGEGHCNGFAFLAQYYLTQQNEAEFYKVLALISIWDGTQESLSNTDPVKELSGDYKDLEDLFNQWINDLVWFQHSLDAFGQENLTTLEAQSRRAEQFETVKKASFKGHIETLFPKERFTLTLDQLTEWLQIYSLHPNTIIEIGGEGHLTSARVMKDGRIKYYDANLHHPLKTFDSVVELAHCIQDTKYKALGRRYQSMKMTLMTYRYAQEGEKVTPISTTIELNEPSPNGLTPLHIAIFLNQPEVVKKLLQDDSIDCNKRDKHGTTPLVLAIKMHANEIVKMLVKKAKVNSPTYIEDSPLISAIRHKNREALNLLLEQPNINIQKAFVEACTPERLPFAKRLIEQFPDLDVNEKDIFQCRPLHKAILSKDPELMKFVLSHGADITLEALCGNTPFELIIHTGELKLVELLLQYMEDVNQVDQYGKSLLHYAIANKESEIVKFLEEKGGRDIAGRDKRNPLLCFNPFTFYVDVNPKDSA